MNGIYKNLLLTAFILLPCLSMAFSPQKEGLGGAGRSGIPEEALFTNPASMGLLTANQAFMYYTKSRISDLDSGGKVFSVGLYDGQNEAVKGGVAYIRESRARITGSGPTYTDRAKIRVGVGNYVWNGLFLGANTDYTIQYLNGVSTSKFFNATFGAAYQMFKDVRMGVTYENIKEKPGEEPPNLGVGIRYDITGPMVLYADGTQIMEGAKKGDKFWALGSDFVFVPDFIVRGGLFQDRGINVRGYSAGFSWKAARTYLEYAFHATFNAPIERDHTIALTTQL